MAPLKKIYLSTIAFATLNILLIVFIVFPLFEEVKKNSEAFLLEKNKIASLSKEEEGREKMEGLYKNYQSDLEEIEKVFVDPEVPIEFIGFLEKTATVSQIQLKILSMIKKIEKEDPWPGLSFQLSAVGSFPDFLRFLEKLENSPYLIETLELNTRALTEKEIKSKEFESFPVADANTLFLIKVFTK